MIVDSPFYSNPAQVVANINTNAIKANMTNVVAGVLFIFFLTLVCVLKDSKSYALNIQNGTNR